AERLLADHGAGRLVVHVEVAGGVAQALARKLDGPAVSREHGAGEAVRRAAVDEVERVGVPALVVDERRDDGPEELLLHRPEVRVARLDHRRLDEPAVGVVVAAAHEHLRLPVRPARLVDRRLLRREGAAVDHGAHEVREVGDVPDLEPPHLLDEPLPELGPEVRGREDPRRRRALLSLVLERAAHDGGRDGVDVRGRVRDDEVLAARLADDSRVVAVALEILRDRSPHAVEDGGRPGEVDAGEVARREHRVADLRPGAVDQVDDAGRHPGLLEELHQEVGGERGRRRRLPDDRVAHQRGGGREVARDRREVERRHREDEPFERPVLEPVPDAGRGDGLLLVDPRHVLDVEAPEVDELARRVDLGLVGGLRLPEHRRRVQRLPPRPREELRRAQEDRRTLLPRRPRPVVPRVRGSGDRAVDLGSTTLVHGCEDVRAVVRLDRLERVAGADLLAADHERDVGLLRLELAQPEAELLALRRARRVAPDRLVVGLRDAEDAVAAHAAILGAWPSCGSRARPSSTTSSRRFVLPWDDPRRVDRGPLRPDEPKRQRVAWSSWIACGGTSRGSPSRSTTSRSTSSTRRRFSPAAPRSCGRCRAARSSPTGSSRRSPARRAPRARPARSARGTGSGSSSRAIASSAPTGSARTGRTASTTRSDCWPSKVSLSEDLRNELAQIAPDADCDRLAELSGLFHVAGSLHLDLVSSAVARRAFALLRAFGVDSEIRTYQQHAFHRATRYQLHVEPSEHAYETLHRAGVLDAGHRPLERPPRRVLARRCCRGAYLRGALLGAGSLSGPRDPHLEIRTAEVEGARFL